MKSVDEILLHCEEVMGKAVEFLNNEFSGLRSGKASPAMVDTVEVEAYGNKMKMNQLGNISTPEPRLIVINPFDPSTLPEIEKGILAANLGVTPMNDGRVIRIPIPELSEERRKEMLKVAKNYAEEQRIAVRNVRREGNDQAKALQKAGDIGEDERDDAIDEVQKATDSYIKQIDAMLAAKEKEMMEV
jgi:ribosome recycling factor